MTGARGQSSRQEHRSPPRDRVRVCDVDIDERLYAGGTSFNGARPAPRLNDRPSNLQVRLMCERTRSAEQRMIRIVFGYL
jgi:hypothetical protein